MTQKTGTPCGLNERSIDELNARYASGDMAALFALGAQWVWETDGSHRYTYVSPILRDVTGINPDELLGLSRSELFLGNPAADDAVQAHLDDLTSHRPFRDFTFRAKSPAGVEHLICISGAPRHDEEGRFIGYLGIGRTLNDTSLQAQALREATEKLKRSERLLGEVFSALPIGMVIYDEHDVLLTCNQRLHDMYPDMASVLQPGSTLRDVLSRAYDVFAVQRADRPSGLADDEDRRALIDAKMRDYHKPGFEMVEKLQDGRFIHHSVRRLDSGLLASLRVDISAEMQRERQVTEAKQAALLASSRLESAIDALPDGFAIWSADDELVICNDAYRQRVSLKVQLQPGVRYGDMVKALAASGDVNEASGREEEWAAQRMAARETATDMDGIYRLEQDVWVLRRDVLLPNGERVDIRTDITDLKNKEQRLEAAYEQARLTQDVISTLDEPIFVKDEHLRFVLVNAAFARIFGRPVSDFIGKTAADFVARDTASRFEASERAVLETGETFEDEEDFFQDGVEKARIVRKSRVLSASGVPHVVGYLIDITELRLRERDLRDATAKATLAEKAKSEFLANMSHEIRTPLNGVIAMADLLARDTLDARQRTFVEIIKKSGQTLLDMICDILDFTRMENDELELDASEFALVDMVEDVARLTAVAADEKDLGLIVDIGENVPKRVIGDMARLRQVLANLLSNAVKFTDSGEIVVTVRAEGVDHAQSDDHRIEFSVQDSGSGIDAEDRGRIFEAFSRGSVGRDAPRRGMGMGLAITGRLLALMGGTCQVDSAPGKGSRFSFRLDFVPAPTTSKDKGEQMTDSVTGGLAGRRAVILDPSEARRQAMRTAFESCGLDVTCVESARLAAALVAALDLAGKPADLLVFGQGAAMHDELMEALAPCRAQLSSPMPVIVEAAPLATLQADGRMLPGVAAQLPLPLTRRSLARDLAALLDNDRTAPAPEQIGLHRVDVLVAEDNEINQLVYAHILGATGQPHEIVCNGKLAVEAARKHRPALVLLDLDMPEMDGLEAARLIRAEAGPGLPIIGVSAPLSAADREACMGAGMNDLLIKPISQDSLLGLIETWKSRRTRRSA